MSIVSETNKNMRRKHKKMQKNLAYFLVLWYNLNMKQKTKRETSKKNKGVKQKRITIGFVKHTKNKEVIYEAVKKMGSNAIDNGYDFKSDSLQPA